MTSDDANDDLEASVIAYGSNLASGAKSSSQAFSDLVKVLIGRGLIITKVSRLWRSQAWPDPQDPPYINAVLFAETQLQPLELMNLLHDIERDFGRVRDGKRNAPRVLDLDLIACGRRIICDDGLVLPHPRAQDRAFVMGPLAEVAPLWTHPVSGRTALDLRDHAPVGRDAYPLEDDL